MYIQAYILTIPFKLNDEDPKFKVKMCKNCVKISKYKKYF